MRLKLLLITIALFLVCGTSYGQTAVSYAAMTTITCPATPVATISPSISGLTFSQISRGAGVTCGTAGGAISGSGFNGTLAANISSSKWYTYSITSDASVSFTLSSLSIVSRVSNTTGTPTVSVQYSIGAGAKTVIGSFTPTTSAATYTITPATAIAVGASQVLNVFIIPINLTAAGTTCRVENTTSATVTMTPIPSSDATLSALTTTAGTLAPSFASATISYTATVPYATTSVTVTPTRNQANATIQARVNSGGYSSVTSGSASNAFALNVGSNTIDVQVTAQDGTTIKTYTITVTRAASSDATLSMLTTTATGLSPVFASGTNTYTASVANATTSVTVTPTSNQVNATIAAQVNGVGYSSVTSGSASGSLALNVGSNTIDVKVTAQNGTTINTYTITVTRALASTDEVDYANLQFPSTGTINVGGAFNVYAQTYELGVTEAPGAGTGIASWIGYSSSNTDPSSAGWTWVLASFNTQSGNNDEVTANIGTALPAGTYYYASRFQLNGGPYKYGGYNGGFWNGTTNVNGTLTVNPHLVDWANLQTPASGTINAGNSFSVYAQVYEQSVTDAVGQGAGIASWIGYSTTNTNPNTWTNWIPATYNSSCSFCGANNDEYIADIGTVLPAGTYYYASRFQLNSGSYSYGGFSGGFWDGVSNVSGVLTIVSPTITVTPSTLTGFTYINGSGPSSNQTYTVSGANLSADILLIAPTDYEICLTAGGTYGSSLSLIQSGGTVATTTIYVRLKAGLAVASYNSENIAATSTGAATKNVACSGSVTAPSGCNELFISEYGEGSGNNKYIEIYNPTSSTITLTGNYDIALYVNGSSTASAIALTGTIAAYSTFVIKHNSASASITENQPGDAALSFNGDDAVALRKASALIDVIGQIGMDPGTQWNSGAISTLDNTLVRKSTIQKGDSNGSDAFDPATEWNGYVADTWTYVGAHESICDPNPIITVSPISLTGFIYILATGPSAEQSFTASGTKLTANIIITPPADYEISTTSGSGFGSSITLTPTSGTIASTTIYVRLKAGLASASYTSENITATSAGATTKNVSCSGTVTQPTITSATTALSGFTYVVGAGPSANQNFTVSGSNLSGNLMVTAPTNYEIATSSGGVYGTTLSYTPSLGIVSSQIIYIRLKSGLAINSYNESISITATNAATKTITLSGTVTGNLESDIITANGESATVSSLENDTTITTTADGTQVWQFTIRDGGSDLTDADNLQTIVNSIVFSQNPGNEINDWSDAIQAVALFNGTTKIADGAVIANQITFSGAPLISVPDNGSVTLTVRLSVQVNPNNTGGNLDGDDFVFNISNANVTTSATGSGFSAFSAANSINGQNVLSVVATKLVFTQQPTSTGIGSPMTTVKVSATDVNGNIDLGFAGNVSLSSTGTMSTVTPVTAIAGVAIYNSIIHTAAGTNLTLSATALSLTLAISTTFDINNVTILLPGDVAILAVNTTAALSSSEDEISFVCFVDVLPGTQFYLTDNGYERVTSGKWGNTEGIISLTRTNSTLPKGSVITIHSVNNGINNAADFTVKVCGTVDSNWTKGVVSGSGTFDLNKDDQVWIMQGGAWSNVSTGNHDATYSGNVLYGWTDIAWKTSPAWDIANGTKGSTIYPKRECYTTDVSNPETGAAFVKFNDPINPDFSTTTNGKLDWIALINNPSNWDSYTSDANYDSGGYNYSGSTSCPTMTVAANTFVNGKWTGRNDTNWFNCGNWDTLEVPDETVDVQVGDNTFNRQAIVDATAPFANSHGNIAKTKNLTITGEKVEVTSNANNKLEVHGNVLINTAGALDMDDSTAAADGQLYLYGNWTNSLTNAAFQEGNGTVHFLGSAPQIINNNIHTNPEEFYNVVLGNDFDTSVSNNLIANGDLTVNAGKTTTVSTGDYLKIQNGLKNNGTVNIKTDGSLVQINDTDTNTGIITYERIVPVIRSTDYTYWSSPVLSQNLQTFSANTPSNKFYSFNAAAVPEDWKSETPSSVSMDKGVGYCIYGPQMATPPAFFVASFIGKPNNGLIPVTIKFNGAVEGTSNLIGNPYPSAIDADKFLFINKDVIEGTIYFWTHNTDLQLRAAIIASGATPGTGALAYTSDDYASYNSTGGTAGSGESAISDPNHSVLGVDLGKIPNGKIAAGQAFFTTSLKASSTATAIFNNSMRIDNLGKIMDNSQFFKTRNPKTKTASTIEKHRIWLGLTNTQGIFKQTLIGYVTDATNEYDTRFDGISFDGNEFVDFYSVNQDKNLVIQGRTLPFDENDEVPLGFRTSIDGAFTINIDQTDGILTNQSVFIEDKLTNTTFDLRSGGYTFNTVAGTFNDRFVLRYTNKTLGTTNFESVENQVLVSNKNKQIKVNSKAETIDKVVIYDLLGRQLFKKEKVNSNEFSILNLASSQQTLLVKVTLQNGETVTRKIIF